MLGDVTDDVTDENRLLLGAGFVFGIAFSMAMLAVVTATVVGTGALFGSAIVATIAAGTLFATITGASLYVLAFPENRVSIPVKALFDIDSGHDEKRTERL